MNNRYKPLSLQEEVVSVATSDKLFMDYPMFRISQLISTVRYMLQRYGNYNSQQMDKWFSEGVDCEIIQLGAKSWKKGKVRVRFTIEFSLDEPEVEETPESNDIEISKTESSLDDIR